MTHNLGLVLELAGGFSATALAYIFRGSMCSIYTRSSVAADFFLHCSRGLLPDAHHADIGCTPQP